MNNTRPLRTILIDDEADARDVLSALLSAHPEVEITGTADNAESGLALIAKSDPDLVFLDIQMPRKNGFDLVDELRKLNLSPTIIFVTAHDEYAIRAIKVAAFDYLLKPVDVDALADTLTRFRANSSVLGFNRKVNDLLNHLHHNDHLKLNTRNGFLLIDPDTIFYALANGNYTEIFLTDKNRELVTINIGKLMELLPQIRFIRISRSALVNRAYLYRILRDKKTCELRKDDFTVQLDVSKEFMRDLK